MRYEPLTGLTHGQLAELAARVAAKIGDVAAAGGRPAGIGLFKSVAMVVALMRRNLVQDAAGAIFGCSQPTVSRRWDLLRPVIGQVLAALIPGPAELAGRNGTVLVDGTIAPTWDWSAIPDLYSGKAGYPGINIQIAATVDGRLAALGLIPVHGARHDAAAFEASGLKDRLAGLHAAADLGYTGVDGIAVVPFRTPPRGHLHESQTTFNTELSKIRAAVEHAIAHLKTWRMLSEEGGRYRCPISKYGELLHAIAGLFFFANQNDPFE